ncbi:hypothetical protein SAMN05660976_08483 [Nonomuraea pusilla]|uniref:Uncharacterized protein n=1 Tax=Nonomuraea pusilla TaxID=46177 RepID=A0A1H8JZB0_9ACTN|nr:hypothetical protein SAMN05660976_08483 [Nonomuraea pusilla]
MRMPQVSPAAVIRFQNSPRTPPVSLVCSLLSSSWLSCAVRGRRRVLRHLVRRRSGRSTGLSVAALPELGGQDGHVEGGGLDAVGAVVVSRRSPVSGTTAAPVCPATGPRPVVVAVTWNERVSAWPENAASAGSTLTPADPVSDSADYSRAGVSPPVLAMPVLAMPVLAMPVWVGMPVMAPVSWFRAGREPPGGDLVTDGLGRAGGHLELVQLAELGVRRLRGGETEGRGLDGSRLADRLAVRADASRWSRRPVASSPRP